MLLAIDTSTRYASLALYDETGVISERTWRSHRHQSQEILPAVHNMLQQQTATASDLSAVAVAKGPGSFTGLRIGMSVGKGLCLALGIPIIAIPTLSVIAYAVGDPGGLVYAVLEAGRGRICVAPFAFDQGLAVQQEEIRIVAASQWTPAAKESVLITGEIDAALADHLLSLPYAESLALSSLAGSMRRAGYLAELAWDRFQADDTDDLDTLSPTYAHYPASGTSS